MRAYVVFRTLTAKSWPNQGKTPWPQGGRDPESPMDRQIDVAYGNS